MREGPGFHRVTRAAMLAAAGLLSGAGLLGAERASAQAPEAEAAISFTEQELEELVGPIALYPDDLIAIILPASTYPLDVVEATRFLDEREHDPSRTPDEDWDDSIVALLNYPEVLRLMDEDLDWTWDLGEAFLTQRADVLEAVQRFRIQARAAGNLSSDERQVVREDGGVIEIAPADPKVIYVPHYEPRRIIVHHHVPIHYYPRPYPVYYYPYPAGYTFHSGFFWGVTTAFVIGWHTHFLHAHHHLHVAHPYHRHRYYDPFYVRRSISINIVNIDRVGHVWRPRHRHGVRPPRVALIREGRVDYRERGYATRTVQPSRRVAVGAGDAAQREAREARGRGSRIAIGGVAPQVENRGRPRSIESAARSPSAALRARALAADRLAAAPERRQQLASPRADTPAARIPSSSVDRGAAARSRGAAEAPLRTISRALPATARAPLPQARSAPREARAARSRPGNAAQAPRAAGTRASDAPAARSTFRAPGRASGGGRSAGRPAADRARAADRAAAAVGRRR